MAEKKPIDQGMLARAVGTLTGKVREALYDTGWFGPSKPLDVMVPEAQEPGVVARQFDYPVAINRVVTPRSTEAVSFAQLRNLAEACDVLRLVIETRKDQMAKLRWSVVPKEADKEQDNRCKELEKFFRFPDKEHDWDTWLRMLLEDLFVIDAPTVYVRKTVGGEMYSFDPVDGSTIKRILDMQGRTPMPPDPAYQQILKGVVASEYSTEELIYRPRNVRTAKIYGYSPVEQIIMTVNIALRRSVHKLQYYTEGNVPEALAGTPEGWTAEQVERFQRLWDSLMEGNTAERRHMKFLPGKLDVMTLKEDVLKDAFDEWLARIVCFAFSIDPTPFVAQVNRSVAETTRATALSEGLAPIMQWVVNLMNFLIVNHFGYEDLEFKWSEEEVQLAPLERAQVHKIYLDAKVLTDDEVRGDLGREPLTDEQREKMKAAAPPMVPGVDPNDPDAVVDPNDPNAKPPNGPPGAKKAAEEEVAKAKKSTPGPIDKDRASIKKIEARIAKFWTKYLSSKAEEVANQVIAEIGKAEETPEEKAARIAKGLDLDFDDSIPRMSALLSVATHEGVVAAFAEIGQGEKDLTSTTVWAKDRAAELVGRKWVDGKLVDNPNAEWVITDSTRDMLQGTIKNAIDQGLTMDELATEIEGSFSFSPERARMIARTETSLADTAGQVAAYKESGVVSGKQWTTSQDDKVSEECLANEAAGVIGLDEVFPSGDEAPPAHPNCRCAVVAVIEED